MKSEKITLPFIILIFCLISLYIATQPPEYSEFHLSEMQLTNYPATAQLNTETEFTLLINDYRDDKNFTTTIYINELKQSIQTLKNGSNTLTFTPTETGKQKIQIEIYDPDNEYIGYGFKTEPWKLMFMVEVV